MNSSPCNLGCEPVSQSKLAVWDVPGAKPPTEPVLPMKWGFAEQYPSAGLLAGDRDASPFSLLYEVPERENSLRECQCCSKGLIFHGDLTNKQRSVFQSFSGEGIVQVVRKGAWWKDACQVMGGKVLVQMSQRGCLA